MATRTVTAQINKADGSPWSGAVVKFRPVDDTYTNTPDETFPITTVTATTNDAGALSVVLVSGTNTEWDVTLPDDETFRIVVAAGATITLEDLRALYDASQPIPPDSFEEVIIDVIEDSAEFTAAVEAAAIAHAAGLIVQEGETTVVAAAGTMDFDASDFNVTQSPAGEANIALAYGTGAGTPAEGNHTHAPTSSTFTVQEGDVNVDTAVTILDFDASDFNVSSSPAGEANVALAYGTGAGTPAEGNHAHTNVKSLQFPFGDLSGTGSAIATTARQGLSIPVGWGTCTITRWRLLADASTTSTVDVWKGSYASGYPPTNPGSITASATPSITAANKNESTTLTGWTTTFTGGDVVFAAVEANNNAKWLLLVIEFTMSED